jgi:hypothetical protein
MPSSPTPKAPSRGDVRRLTLLSPWLASLIAVAAILLAIAIYVPTWLYPALSNQELNSLKLSGEARVSAQDDRLSLQNNARTELIQILASIAVLSGASVAWRQLRHTVTDAADRRDSERQSLLLDHYSKGIQYTGDETPAVRLGGIHLLTMLAEGSPMHRDPVRNVLASFISDHAPWPPVEGGPPAGAGRNRIEDLSTRAPDVQGALTVLGRQVNLWEPRGVIRLGKCDLRSSDLTFGFFESADFTGSHLEWSSLRGAKLSGAALRGANLDGADLTDADLCAANISGAIFREARLDGVKLSETIFDDATVWPSGFTAESAKGLGARNDS